MSATDNLGPHLLGRKRVDDPRDWPLEAFLETDNPLVALNGAVQSSHYVAKVVKAWVQEATNQLAGTPTPSPTPTPTPQPTPTPVGDILWVDPETVLDQGQTPHCVGFGWAQWGNDRGLDNVDDHYKNADGDAIYGECKVIDGEPGAQDGSSVRSGAQAMKNRGRLNAYAFTHQQPSVLQWLNTKGPVVIGSDWTDDMFNPDDKGFVHPTGAVAGGHCYLLVGNLHSLGAVLALNSWGTGWGLGGYFKITHDDLTTILTMNGEACAAVELP